MDTVSQYVSDLMLPAHVLRGWFAHRFRATASQNPQPIYGPVPSSLTRVLRDLRAQQTVRMQALDLACGDGRYTVTLAAAGYDVVAVDDLPEAIERAEWLAGELGVLDAIEFRKASLPEAFASLGSFNFVICGSCFLHLLGRPTTENIIDLVQKSTRAGGVNYICLSTDVIRRLPCGRRFFYDGEASYAVAEAETVLRQMYAHWDILLLEKQPVQEEWDIPPVAYQYLQAKHYQRTEVELTFAARAPGLKE